MARVVAVAAHPDDETLFGAGYLARRALAGDEVYVIGVTRGEGGEVGEPPVGPKSSLGDFREREMRAAVQALGGVETLFMGYVDPHADIGGMLHPIDTPFELFADHLARYLADLRPDTVITHGSNGEYGHPQHIFTHRATRAALDRLPTGSPTPRFVTWCAHAPETGGDRLTNPDDPADEVLRLAGTPLLDRKMAAVFCYGSQHAMMRRNNQGRRVFDVVRRIEAYRHWSWPLPPLPPDPFAAPARRDFA